MGWRSMGWLLALACALGAAARGGETMGDYEVIGREERHGVLWVRVRSPYQRGETLVRVVTAERVPPPEKRRVLFVLPVEPGTQSRFGDGLKTMQKLDVANRFGFVVVAPTFSALPWFCDHPSKPELRQETYMLKVVVALVAKLYPHEAKHRGLLGFSKSGWGAFCLLLRHPEAFGAAVAWDAPFLMSKPSYGMAAIVGSQANFERHRVPSLLERHAEALRGRKRLAHFGYGNFREHHQQTHALMERLRIPHAYADGPKRRHHWDGGWVPDAVRLLDGLLRQQARREAAP